MQIRVHKTHLQDRRQLSLFPKAASDLMAPESQPATRHKVVFVGDNNVGKSTLFIVFTRGQFPEVYVPTVMETTEVPVHLDERTSVLLSLWDVGDDDYSRQRQHCYPDTDVFVLCFSVGCPESLDNVESQWFPEIRHYNPHTPILLVGCQKDLRDDPETLRDLARFGGQPVRYDEALYMAQRMGATRYIECSAMQNVGVADVFTAIGRQCVTPPSIPKARRRCVLL
ncbi:P-loop containing nucleoside triphosphate hydrolase protein [Zopfochytrium polystomum]|nr:P-loop containing nucleoside triphosphate hydrolase protein [Zopfochytrium polystomum]